MSDTFDSFSLRVLYEDDGLRVLDKPSGLSVLKDNTGHTSLSDLYPIRFGEHPFFVHRLDKGTSGVLAIARTTEVQRALSIQFDRRQVEKAYLALVEGRPEPNGGTLDLPIEKARKGKQRIALSGGGKPAVTHYETLWTDGTQSLLTCRPETGRTHQIRVHLAHLGCPLLSDPLYGAARGKPSEHPFLTLHAWRLAMKHPATQARIEVEAPPPDWALAFL